MLPTCGFLLVVSAGATVSQAEAQEPQRESPTSEAPPSTDETELSKKVENPISDLISVPLQNNFNFGIGPENRMQYLLNVQPVLPMAVGDWMIVHRPIVPILDQPGPGEQRTFGLGDVLYTPYLSPPPIGPLMVGIGPGLQLPTATSSVLGTGQWATGPSAVVAMLSGPWVAVALATQVWSFAGKEDRPDVSALQMQAFLFHNLSRGWAIGTAPLITAEWTRSGRDVWTLPIGAQISKILVVPPGLPLQLSAGGYGNVLRPSNGPDAQLRVLVAVLLPR